MVKFEWTSGKKKVYDLDGKYRGLKYFGKRPNFATIYRKNDTDPIEPTELEFDARFRQIEYALHPSNREVRYECEEAREQFEWRVS